MFLVCSVNELGIMCQVLLEQYKMTKMYSLCIGIYLVGVCMYVCIIDHVGCVQLLSEIFIKAYELNVHFIS